MSRIEQCPFSRYLIVCGLWSVRMRKISRVFKMNLVDTPYTSLNFYSVDIFPKEKTDMHRHLQQIKQNNRLSAPEGAFAGLFALKEEYQRWKWKCKSGISREKTVRSMLIWILKGYFGNAGFTISADILILISIGGI